jgi:hypothetical protein
MIFKVSFLQDRQYITLQMTNGVLELLFSTGIITANNRAYHLGNLIKIVRVDDDHNFMSKPYGS